MAMVQCPECGREISDKAYACPHCGFPMREAPAAETYELRKGGIFDSGFSSFLMVLAVITWIGGLIIAIAGAQVEYVVGYHTETKFSFSVFLTLIAPFIIYGAILCGLASMAQKISYTYLMVKDMELVRKQVQKEISDSPRTKQKRIPTAKDAGPNTGMPAGSKWTKDDQGFYICPRCGMKVGPSRIDKGEGCPGCGFGSGGEDASGEPDEAERKARAGDHGWIPDDDVDFVICPSCNRRVAVDYIRIRKQCPDCGQEY